MPKIWPTSSLSLLFQISLNQRIKLATSRFITVSKICIYLLLQLLFFNKQTNSKYYLHNCFCLIIQFSVFLFWYAQRSSIWHSMITTSVSLATKWAEQWLVSFNPTKTESLTISRKRNKPTHPPLVFNNTQINNVTFHKHLGITFSNNGTWHTHIQEIKNKAWQRINILRSFKFTLDRKSLETIYFSFIRPMLEYADVVWDNITQSDVDDLERIQIEAARIFSGGTQFVSYANLYKETLLEPLKDRRDKHKLILFYKMKNSLSPAYLSSLVPPSVGHTTPYWLRNTDEIRNIHCNSELFSKSFLPSTIVSWNSLPATTQNLPTLSSFKNALNINKKKVPEFYYQGNREASIQHARLRMHCSSLKEHLY